MALISETFDVRIQIVFPERTKSLADSDLSRLNATGTFNFSPAPQVDTSTRAQKEAKKEKKPSDRAKVLEGDLNNLLVDFKNIQKAIRKKSKHLSLDYDPEAAQNEALANAEAEIFGVASGHITYEMFEQVVEFQEKINKYISHSSIENEGALDGIVA